MSPVVGLLLIATSLVATKLLDAYVARHRCSEMVGMMVGMVAGMTAGLLIGEVLGFLSNMLWGNILAVVAAAPLGAYVGRHGRQLGRLDGAMAGAMGGMMGAMLGVMLKFPPEHGLAMGLLLLLGQTLALTVVAYIVKWHDGQPSAVPDYYAVLGVDPQATAREVAAAYLRCTEAQGDATSPERARVVDEALAVLSDPFRRLAYDRARQVRSGADRTSQTVITPSTPAARAVRDIAAGSTTGRRWQTWTGLGLTAAAIAAFSFAAARPPSCPPAAVAAEFASLADVPSLMETPSVQTQVVNLTIQYPCYYPDRITVQSGVPVEFNVGTIGDPGCGRQLVVQGLGINRFVAPGQITSFQFTPERAGSYTITCGMRMMKPATLTVVE